MRPAEPRSGARTRPLDAIGGEIRSVVRVGGVLLTPHPLPRGERGGWRGAAPTAPRLRSGRRRPHKQRHPATGRVAFFRGPAGAVSGVPRPRSGRRRGGSPLEEKGKILILNKNNKLGGCNRKQGFRTTGSSLLPLTSYNRKKKSLHRTVDSE